MNHEKCLHLNLLNNFFPISFFTFQTHFIVFLTLLKNNTSNMSKPIYQHFVLYWFNFVKGAEDEILWFLKFSL
jgi:hypothetical protein